MRFFWWVFHKAITILTCEICSTTICKDRNHPFIYCAITGSCKEASKKQKGGSNESEEEWESKPFLGEHLDFLVGMLRMGFARAWSYIYKVSGYLWSATILLSNFQLLIYHAIFSVVSLSNLSHCKKFWVKLTGILGSFRKAGYMYSCSVRRSIKVC